MECFADTYERNKASFPEQELAEEEFLDQFGALEDGLAHLQIHLRALSENVKLFGSLATQMRRCAVAAASSETSEMERPTL